MAKYLTRIFYQFLPLPDSQPLIVRQVHEDRYNMFSIFLYLL